MAFVVDGAEWKFDGKDPAEALAAIEGFLQTIGDAKQAGSPVWFGEEFQRQAVLDDEDLWSLCRAGSPLSLPQEVWQELSAYLGRAELYADDGSWPQDFPTHVDISISGGPFAHNMDVAWAHHSVRAGRAVACVGLWRSGAFSTSSHVGSATVHWIGNETSMAEFWRAAIDVEGNSLATFERLAPRAYPRLHFLGNVLHQADVFVGGYHANAPELRRYLSVLNDAGEWAFTAAPPSEIRTDPPGEEGQNPSKQLVQRRLERLHLVVAPENPNVSKDGKCRRAREVELKGKVLYCEWHCKLEAHQNRVHIHAPVPESDGKLVVAIFADHLPLPGG
jgi:hypothetical protein